MVGHENIVAILLFSSLREVMRVIMDGFGAQTHSRNYPQSVIPGGHETDQRLLCALNLSHHSATVSAILSFFDLFEMFRASL